MDIVYIRDLRIETIIGIYDWEREVKQTVSLDLEMAHDIRKAAETDDIQYALNYKSIAKRLIVFSVPWLKLRVSKPGALRGSQDVGIIIERGERT